MKYLSYRCDMKYRRHRKEYRKLGEFGKRLLDHPSVEKGLPMIAEYARDIVGAERSSIFLHDSRKGTLWTILSDGMSELVINDDEGVAGAAFQIAEPMMVNDVQNDPRFFSRIDGATGFRTENLIVVPILNSENEPIGVFELMNSSRGAFDEDDLEFLEFFTAFIESYIELAVISKKVKEKEERKRAATVADFESPKL
jgi:GAF domain-containing protein